MSWKSWKAEQEIGSEGRGAAQVSADCERGFSVEHRIIERRLTDESEEGGLFGFRF
ncbi:hypothetical protein [Streptomyces tailanensis]|uniref:hypothetical protein n=1 Tax=Streptomyces tailanensis TaxID=2569858 RepID=UPI001FE85EC9|nr:hypothetical protein [Streptomyces tailanensis]